MTNALGFLNPFDKNIHFNSLNCAALRLDFIQGIGKIRLLLIDLPKITASGAGGVDLRKEHLDIIVHPAAKEGIGASGLGKINISLSNIAKSFKIKGSLRNPEIKINQSAAATSIAKTIGGIALFGPVGIVTSLVGASDVDQTPCPCALNIARYGDDTHCSKSEKQDLKDKKTNPEDTGNPLKKILNIFD